jgi:hypothetical protein
VDDINLHALLITLVGGAVALAALAGTLFRRLGLSALVAYMLIGLALRLLDSQWPLLSPPVERGLDLLADLGLVAPIEPGVWASLSRDRQRRQVAQLGHLASRYWAWQALLLFAKPVSP